VLDSVHHYVCQGAMHNLGCARINVGDFGGDTEGLLQRAKATFLLNEDDKAKIAYIQCCFALASLYLSRGDSAAGEGELLCAAVADGYINEVERSDIQGLLSRDIGEEQETVDIKDSPLE
jgi:hypothetical protein